MLLVNQLIGFGAGGDVFPIVAETSTSVEGADATSHTVDMPSTVNAGDRLIVIFACDGIPTIDWTGTGFTEFFVNDALSTATLSIAYKDAAGTEGGGTITVGTSASEESAHIVYRIIRAEAFATQAPEVSIANEQNTATPSPNSLTPTGGAKKYLWLVVNGRDENDTVTSFPADYRGGIDLQSSSDFGKCSASSAQRELNAASEQAGTFTLSASDGNCTVMVAIHPPAS